MGQETRKEVAERTRLAPGIAFGCVDGIGVFVDTIRDHYYELDACQLLLFQALLQTSNREEAVLSVKDIIIAKEKQLYDALEDLAHQLLELGLIETANAEEASDVPRFPARLQSSTPSCAAEHIPLAPALKAPLRQGQKSLSWEVFLPGTTLLHLTYPRVTWGQRLHAFFQAIRVLYLFRREDHWIIPCNHILKQCHPVSGDGVLAASPDTWLPLARREILWPQAVLHLLFPFGPSGRRVREEPEGLCLPRSLGLCAYLRALGFPASMILARARFSNNSGTQAYHAWTEVAGFPVNESPEIHYGYTTLLSLPNA